MEMVSGQAMVLSLMACALLSSGVARLVTRPMYQELAALLPLPRTHRATPGEAMNTALRKLLSWLRSTWRRARVPERADTVIVPPAPPVRHRAAVTRCWPARLW